MESEKEKLKGHAREFTRNFYLYSEPKSLLTIGCEEIQGNCMVNWAGSARGMPIVPGRFGPVFVRKSHEARVVT